MAENKWITVDQMADFKGVTRAAVTNWLRRGQLTSKIEPKYNITIVDKTSLTVSERKKRTKKEVKSN